MNGISDASLSPPLFPLRLPPLRRSTIPADFLAQPGRIIRVPASALRSPKVTMPPPILVEPGGVGTPIPQVTVGFR
jgi:hypothetical protein